MRKHSRTCSHTHPPLQPSSRRPGVTTALQVGAAPSESSSVRMSTELELELSEVTSTIAARTGMCSSAGCVRRLPSFQPTDEGRGRRPSRRGGCAREATPGARAHGAGQPARAPAACGRCHHPLPGQAALQLLYSFALSATLPAPPAMTAGPYPPAKPFMKHCAYGVCVQAVIHGR